MKLSALLRRRPNVALFPIALHVAGSATTEIYFDGRQQNTATLTAIHRDLDGVWFEEHDGRSLLNARDDDEFSAIGGSLRLPSGHPIAPNRFNGLVVAAAEWFE